MTDQTKAIELLEAMEFDEGLVYSRENRERRDQALAKLRQAQEQPPASNFTKKCRAMAEVALESTEKLTEDKLAALLKSNWNGVGFIMRIFGTILEGRLAAKEAIEACDRLDTETQEKRLWKKRVNEAAECIKDYEDLEAKLKAKDELLFAYESVSAPVNPLLSINKDLLEALEKYGGHDDACAIRPSFCICGLDDIIAKAKEGQKK